MVHRELYSEHVRLYKDGLSKYDFFSHQISITIPRLKALFSTVNHILKPPELELSHLITNLILPRLLIW